jgi:hypothetical protein
VCVQKHIELPHNPFKNPEEVIDKWLRLLLTAHFIGSCGKKDVHILFTFPVIW